MPVDTSIYNRLQSFQMEDPNRVRAEMAQVQSLQNRNKLFDMQVAESQRGLERQNKLSEITRNAFDPATGKMMPEKMRQGLGQAGDYEGLQKFETQQAATAKAKAEADKAALSQAIDKQKVVAQYAGAAKDQQTWTQGLQELAAMGIDVSQVPQQFDPATAETFRNRALTGAQQLEQKWKAMEFTTPSANARLQAETSTANSQRSTNASLANASATREIAKATRDAASIKVDRDTEMKIADDYRAQSKPFKEVGDAYRTINATLDKASTSPAATLAAATKFMKLLDPGSVVRESELGMALQASGVFDRATNYFNVLQRGKVLTPNQVADFKNITAQIYAAAQAGQKEIDASYTQQAKTYGLRPEMIVQDLGQNKGASSPAGEPKAGAVMEGYRFKGGDPGNKANWEKM